MCIVRFDSLSRAASLAAAAALALTAAPARAGDLFAAESVSATADLRLAAADGEPSWTDGGFGKARFGGENGDFRLRPSPVEGELIWQPRFAWSTTGTFVVAAQRDQEHPVDLVEAFLSLKPLPHGRTRFLGRAGLFWPPVSLEHEGAGWSVPDMITPSAINSWIGEEVKVLGAEGTLSRDFSGHRLSATAAVFGYNDTAGTLLAFRGWALHDLKATAFGHQKLPRLNDFMLLAQAPATKPAIELDGRPGYYAKLAWRMPGGVAVDASWYDNRGDPEAVDEYLQWGWRTRFLDVGLSAPVGAHTKILAQAMTGGTRMGFDDGAGIWVRTSFRAAYLKGIHTRGRATLSGRIDLFGTTERGAEMGPEESEDGWAAAAAGSYKLSGRMKLLIEALHVGSRRDSRVRVGLDPNQAQSSVQTALRVTL